MNALGDLKPRPLWNYFAQLCKVPRISQQEEAVRQLLVDFAAALGLGYQIDSAGNLIVRKPATAGYEGRCGVILQSHLDMVPQKNSGINHDFDVDPIRPLIDNGWVRADGTTLGADNGIGVAAMMAVLAADDLHHGPIEALFTVDEERGMSGAEGLEAGVLQGDILFNLDSEDEGELFVGCAGCVDIVATASYSPESQVEHGKSYEIFVSGLKGGHSGCDIHLGRGNANKIMNRLLKRATEELGLAISTITGGSLRNAIPRESIARVVVPVAHAERLRQMVDEVARVVAAELEMVDSGVKIEISDTAPVEEVMPSAVQAHWLAALACCPHGVQRMSDTLSGVVETSNNLATLNIGGGVIEVGCMARSAVDSAIDELADAVCSCFSLVNADTRLEAPSPGWRPNMQSPILEVLSTTYKRLFGEKPAIKVIHAGLECGLLGGTYPHWDMISFGPTIRFPHSPDERVDIKTVGRFWQLLTSALADTPESKRD
ncbi:aminoacyl-histidine dipeptidase [Aestuariirhabdus sp. LZHN29]|uniref:aminoacyl-histidine dipeptidase n=1 Tax=Aestuariirhabdus sp. LZHN29 TaxID=3417462 RepID=UPI003CEA4C6F